MPATWATRFSSRTSSATWLKTSSEAGFTYPRRTFVTLGQTRADAWFDEGWQNLMRFEIARCRELYASADLGTAMLPATSQRCIQAARDLYSGILDKIEEANFDVFTTRVRVTTTRKVAMGLQLIRPRRNR